MRVYNVIGYAIIALYALACLVTAPPQLGPGAALAIGAAYFVGACFEHAPSGQDDTAGSPI